jgi:hypothetical protein
LAVYLQENSIKLDVLTFEKQLVAIIINFLLILKEKKIAKNNTHNVLLSSLSGNSVASFKLS